MKYIVPIEVRESREGPRLHGTLIQEGRLASQRAEVFAPNSLTWSTDGVGIRIGHDSPIEVRAMPTRLPDGRIQVAVRATDPIIQAVSGGADGLSIEFRALEESRNAANVREITLATLMNAALVPNPEYTMTQAELRSIENDERFYRWL